ncbi:MAG TPA: pyridoxamine 5'-phosphate oxidase [Leptolyngbyaceae cyanobacterium M33_DOE_097]|uniref:Pyridoxine/pyridoxamine 5'-phosphate oxidase n=1 Tax=Oscillatoriales cyanobacterium SpSt-418 TaxID=2282169 RepID=A0A7C3PG27_9CYAN|nr:pyridoxamine 5'-phosphate oxidase [Leptolyngbyaceae cyanobacterium M33_DOE_097]
MTSIRSIADLRVNYSRQQLLETDVASDPIHQFQRWFDQAVESEVPEPNAMTLATATKTGIPSARIVLLKGLDEQGFVFYTNYESRKAQDLAENPQAALVFLWHELERQVRVEGAIEKVSDAETTAYFHSRPLSSQIGAWASEQSRVIPDREVLEQSYLSLEAKYKDQEIPRPPHWGGYRVKPYQVEFWQGRPSRLHDRLRYRLVAHEWVIERLAP